MGDSSDPRRQPGQELAASADAVAHAATPSPDSTEDGASPRGGYDPADYRWVSDRRRPRLDGWTEEKMRRSIEILADTGQVSPTAEGVRFVRPPAEQPYGTVAVLEDLSGDLWDLVQPANEARDPATREPDMNLTDLLVPTYRNVLRTLRGLVDKAEAQLGGGGAEALLRARLAPDMFPLATQIRFACLQAQEAPLRLLGRSLEPLDELLNEGRNAVEQPGTLSGARARIDEALAFLDGLGPDALDQAPAGDPIVLVLPMGLTFDLTREQFARDWAIAQLYFHVMAAYAILRKEGIAVGKADYVPHMFAYLREPGPSPAQP